MEIIKNEIFLSERGGNKKKKILFKQKGKWVILLGCVILICLLMPRHLAYRKSSKVFNIYFQILTVVMSLANTGRTG